MLCKANTIKAITITILVIIGLLMTSFCVRHIAFETMPTQTVIPEEDTIHTIRMVDITNGD